MLFCGRCRWDTNETSLSTIYCCHLVILRPLSKLGLLVSLRGQVYEKLVLDNALITVTTHPGG